MIELTMEPVGLGEFMSFLEEVSNMPAQYSGASLSSTPRASGTATNSEILEYLAGSGRDFKNVSGSQVSAIEQAAADELQRRIDVYARRITREAGKASGLKGRALTSYVKQNASRGSVKGDDRFAKQAQGAMLKKAMEAYMRAVETNIENQIAPGGVAPLSEAYAEYKRKTFGFETPIGKATGQLLENLDTSISAKNIKLEK